MSNDEAFLKLYSYKKLFYSNIRGGLDLTYIRFYSYFAWETIPTIIHLNKSKIPTGIFIIDKIPTKKPNRYPTKFIRSNFFPYIYGFW